MRDDKDLEISMSGQVEMEAKTMIVTATAMQDPCGQFPSTLPSTPERMPTTMNLAPPHLHQPFLMVLKIQTQGLQQLISMANVQEPTLEPLLLHQKLQEYLPSPLKLIASLHGVTCNI